MRCSRSWNLSAAQKESKRSFWMYAVEILRQEHSMRLQALREDGIRQRFYENPVEDAVLMSRELEINA